MPLPDLIDNGLGFSQLPCPANTAAAKAQAGAPAAARAQPGLTNWEPGARRRGIQHFFSTR